jgi:hypothetical protein
MEATKKGEAHLHILLRSEYIEHEYISEAMRDLIKAPVVWIRQIRDQGKMAAYVAKYCSKDLAKFRGCKRYGYTKNWAISEEYLQEKATWDSSGWRVANYGIATVERECLLAGAAVRWTSQRTFEAEWQPSEMGKSHYGVKISGELSGGTEHNNDWRRYLEPEPGDRDGWNEPDMARRGYSKTLMRIERLQPRLQYVRFKPPTSWTRTRRRGENTSGELYKVAIWEENVHV